MSSADFHPGCLRGRVDRCVVDDRPVPVALRTREPVRKMVFRITRPDRQQRWLKSTRCRCSAPTASVTQVVVEFHRYQRAQGVRAGAAPARRDPRIGRLGGRADLLTAPDWEHGIEDVLRQLGAATAVSRVYIVPGYPRVARASATSGPPKASPSGPTRRGDEPYLRALGLERWESILREGGTIQGPQHRFPDDERDVLRELGVCSTRRRADLRRPVVVGLHRLRRLPRRARLAEWRGRSPAHRPRGRWARPSNAAAPTPSGCSWCASSRRAPKPRPPSGARRSWPRRATSWPSSLDYEATLQSLANLVVPDPGRLLLDRHARSRRLDPPRRPGAVDPRSSRRRVPDADRRVAEMLRTRRAAAHRQAAARCRRWRGRRLHERPDGAADDPRGHRMAC